MSRNHWRILVFPGGTENGLEIQRSLKACKEVSLFSASSPVPNHAEFAFKECFTVRDINDKEWIHDLNDVIAANRIDLIFPANSCVIDELSRSRGELLAPVLLPLHEVIDLTRSKKATIRALQNTVPVPKLFEKPEDIDSFPVFSKPNRGYGSQGAQVILDAGSATNLNFEKNIVQEYLPGEEVTVDCFSDPLGQLLFSGARSRLRIRMGTSMRAEAADHETQSLMREYALKILSKVKIPGAWFFQMKRDADGTFKLLEIDVRIAGTMCFNRCKGINFPLLSIYQFFGKNISILENSETVILDRSLQNRYKCKLFYGTVYIDLDDTIIIHNKLNVEAVHLIYQCINKKIKIVLLSKCRKEDPMAYLRSWRIDALFDEIFWLKEAQSKADFITDESSIFIDDSFSQRVEVSQKKGIPTFDPSMIEVLLDHRI